ncbi:small glutamine-rich tetratricopeptide repeat-containing protein-like [Neltuma alba]|uniref:small glutamine-rich tetratricopeptide repeat-containing protein-like n=1 Tax=Neltuma alba TaxID=207710 RepID=UPI0010A540BB|nr:small glutamine-rich tetratricopeptide repeat-containing protein-like [Prosopis alba]
MANLTTSSQICIRIVIAFLQFLSTVQAGNKEEKERIKSVAKILKEIFKISQEMVEDDQKLRRPGGILVTLFSTPQDDNTEELEDSENEPCSSTAPTTKRTSSSKGGVMVAGRNMANLQKDFKQAVLKNGGLECLVGHNNPKKRIHGIIGKIFNEALGVIRQEKPFRFNMKDVAETLKTLGNKAMETNCYTKAAEFYSCAIAINVDNAVYYCNRGAALIKMGRFHEAVRDCCKAIILNPTYIKAYYRLGLAYSEQGNSLMLYAMLEAMNKAALAQIELAEGRLSEQLSWLDDKLEDLRKSGMISRCRKVGIKEGTTIVYKGKAEDGDSEKFVLLEDEVDTSNINIEEETMSIAEFIDLFSNSNMAP